MPTFKLQSYDGKIFEAGDSFVKMSGTIRTMLNDCFTNVGDEEVIVPLPNVNSATLEKVLEWADHHKDDPVDSEDEGKKDKKIDKVDPWVTKFMKVDQGTLFDMTLAANYLDAKGLMEACKITTANMIKGKTVEQLRRIFNIENDFPDEKDVRKV